MIIIYHNPRCTKSRETLALIKNKTNDFVVKEYLKDIPTAEELRIILMKLKMKPEDLIRKGEAIFKEKIKGLKLSDDEWIKVMREHPILIERPIVVKENKAIIGRPPTNVEELL